MKLVRVVLVLLTASVAGVLVDRILEPARPWTVTAAIAVLVVGVIVEWRIEVAKDQERPAKQIGIQVAGKGSVVAGNSVSGFDIGIDVDGEDHAVIDNEVS